MKVVGVTVDLNGSGSSRLSPLWSGKVGTTIVICDQTVCACGTKYVSVCVRVCMVVCMSVSVSNYACMSVGVCVYTTWCRLNLWCSHHNSAQLNISSMQEHILLVNNA